MFQLSYPGSASSTGGCRIAIIDTTGTAVTSNTGTLLPPNTIQVYRCTPGQRVSAISNDAGTFSLSITELTDWMLDDKWIDKLRPEECVAALESLASFGAMTAKEATTIQRWQRALKARTALLADQKK